MVEVKNILLSPTQVYFGMLDALLAEEKIPEEYSGQTQVDYVLQASFFVIFEKLKILVRVKEFKIVCTMNMQVILCNDCEKRGTASFHWFYHKCPYCGSYNTRLLWLSSQGCVPEATRYAYEQLFFSVDKLILS